MGKGIDFLLDNRMLLSWADLRPDVALELLDANFGDEHIRAYAVSRLNLLSDDEVVDYLVQLIQVLKYEPYHDNALSRFVIPFLCLFVCLGFNYCFLYLILFHP